MHAVTVSVTGVGTSNWIKLDRKSNPFNVGFGCAVTGTVSYKVEHTFDDVDKVVSPVAFPHSTVVAQTANADGNYAFPVRAVRLNITSGTGTVAMTLIQAGHGG